MLDYAVWSNVERRLRKQEQKMGNKAETRVAFEKRLDRTALSVPAEDVDNWIGDMHKRCQQLYAAKGGLFEEGGLSKRRRTAWAGLGGVALWAGGQTPKSKGCLLASHRRATWMREARRSGLLCARLRSCKV